MKVNRLPKDPGPAAWNAILPEQTLHPELEQRQNSDWLVIGAGFAGLAAARRLSQLWPGASVTILEARQVAQGPAGRNSGFMIDLPHDLASDDYGGDLKNDLLQIRMNRAAIAFARSAAEEYQLGDEAFARSGKINAAASARGMKHNLDYAAHLKKLGEPYQLFDAGRMSALTGTSYYSGGLYTPGAVMIQPALFIRGVAEGLVSNRVHLFENSPVVSLDRDAGNWTAQTPKGAITAPKVILAVNGHAESFGYFERQLLHVFTYASMTRELTPQEVIKLGGEPVWGCTPADPMGTTVRRISGIGGDRIVVRNRFTYEPTMEVNNTRIRSVAGDHDNAFSNRFPMLAGVRMEYRWGGRLCLSRNNVPAFGAVEEGLYAACCQNGLGTAKGTLSGMLAAECATGLHSELLDGMISQPEPQRLPPEPLARIGANAVIRWGEFKAGMEL